MQYNSRKIIHIDMDCFFAAIEMRDNPALKGKPVAVGGTPAQRGVLSTCNYEARHYGLHSAMATTQALRLCPQLILLPVNMEKYHAAAKVLYRIFCQYTPLVEPLSLDEAFLDVTACPYCKGSATLIAQTIKKRIKKELRLTASAGVAPNKFLAKIASEWKKPDGLFVITPTQIDAFIKQLPVTKIHGVGKVTAQKLHAMNLKNCNDLQQLSSFDLIQHFGKFGERLYELCRGIDERPVIANAKRKSLSVEETFPYDLIKKEECNEKVSGLIKKLKRRLAIKSEDFSNIHKQFVKIKFYNFKQTTIERVSNNLNDQLFYELFFEGFNRQNIAIRLIGIGVRFLEKQSAGEIIASCDHL